MEAGGHTPVIVLIDVYFNTKLVSPACMWP